MNRRRTHRSGEPAARVGLGARAVVRLVGAFLLLFLLLFLPAGTLDYWEAWVWMSVYLGAATLTLTYLLVKDPVLLERRMKTKERDAGQRRILRWGAVSYVLALLVPGLDRRFGWSDVPAGAVLASDAVVLLGYAWFVLVLRENSYASRVVEVVPGQQLVTTGPYRIVRHPMYLGILVMFLFTPMALGSWWAVLTALPLCAILVARLRGEERLLEQELPGYRDYQFATRYRLIPGVW